VNPAPEQRTYARLAGICLLANYILQGLRDSVTIVLRRGETFAETARYAAENYRRDAGESARQRVQVSALPSRHFVIPQKQPTLHPGG